MVTQHVGGVYSSNVDVFVCVLRWKSLSSYFVIFVIVAVGCFVSSRQMLNEWLQKWTSRRLRNQLDSYMLAVSQKVRADCQLQTLVVSMFLITLIFMIAFSALTLLVVHREEHLSWKENWVMRCWRGYLSGSRCKRFAHGPADATATPSFLASLRSRIV